MAKSNARITNVNASSNAIRQISDNTASNERIRTQNIATFLSGTVDERIRTFNTSRVTKYNNDFIENFSKNFSTKEPEILFVADYVIDGTKHGVLIVWEKYYDASHYEIFKKNSFKAESTFERILFIDTPSLVEETSHYLNYLTTTVGLDIDRNKTYVVLDTIIKEDRIYEYKIKASRVPLSAPEVAYEYILQSKNLTKNLSVDLSSITSVYDFAGITLGSRDLAWSIALLNDQVYLFGRDAVSKTLSSLELEQDANGSKYVVVANNLKDVMTIMNESVSLFGLQNTYIHIIRMLGGLSQDFIDSFRDATDESRNMFSYDSFKESIRKKVPAYNLALQVAQTGGQSALIILAKLLIKLPSNTGFEAFSSVESVTKIFKFLQDTYVAALWSQDRINVLQGNSTDAQTVGQQFADSISDTVGEENSDIIGNVIDVAINAGGGTTQQQVNNDSNKITANGSNASVAPSVNTSTMSVSQRPQTVSNANESRIQTTTRTLSTNSTTRTRTRTL